MGRKLLAALALAAVCGTIALAQQKLRNVKVFCDFLGEEVEANDLYTFASDQEAENAVAEILRHAGLQKNFDVRAANVPNAVATIQGSQRLILYNQTFMEDVRKQTGSVWAAKSILAHEIGHHLQGHTLRPEGSEPAIELEADQYSGFILCKMGAKLEDAQIAITKLATEEGSATHPGRSARLAAIANGWKAAGSPAPPAPGSTPDSKPNEQPTVREADAPRPDQSPQQLTYVARCVFQSDPNAYFVTSNNLIIGVNSLGQSAIVGRRVPPTYREFAWMYQTAHATYGVSPEGYIWTRRADGVGIVIGYVTAPR